MKREDSRKAGARVRSRWKAVCAVVVVFLGELLVFTVYSSHLLVSSLCATRHRNTVRARHLTRGSSAARLEVTRLHYPPGSWEMHALNCTCISADYGRQSIRARMHTRNLRLFVHKVCDDDSVASQCPCVERNRRNNNISCEYCEWMVVGRTLA